MASDAVVWADLVNDGVAEAVATFVLNECTITATDAVARIDAVDSLQDDGSRLRMGTGSGETAFEWKGERMALSRQKYGQPLTGRNMARETVVHERVMLGARSREALLALCKEAMVYENRDVFDERFRVSTWAAEHELWRRQAIVPHRPWESVVLEPTVEARLRADLDEFVSSETRDWYMRHGVPYRRGYLFHGPPGTGKTSMVSVIASTYKRSVYRLNLVAPRLCDNSLQLAVSQVRDNSIVVMEDIDCLFGKMREKNEQFCVTFSGLLNAIDGLQDASRGVIFVFTSNHPDRLDAAMRRKGRIDVELEFGSCTKWQLRRMFTNFYPDAAPADADAFVAKASKYLPLTPAQLQEFFVRSRQLPAAVAAHDVSFEYDGAHAAHAADAMWS